LISTGVVVANPGDLVKTIDVPVPSNSGIGIGVAFDGQYLYYSNYGETKLYKIDTDGNLIDTIEITGLPGGSSIGAMAYDSTRDKIWAGLLSGCGIYLIDPATGVAQYVFSPACDTWNFCDGLAWDPTDDTLWYSDDVSDTIYHYATDGTLIESQSGMTSKLGGYGSSGITLGWPVSGVSHVYVGNDGGSEIYDLDKSDFSVIGVFAAVDAAVGFNVRVEDMECDSASFPDMHVIWVKDAYNDKIYAFEVEYGTCASPALPEPVPEFPPFAIAALGLLGAIILLRRK